MNSNTQTGDGGVPQVVVILCSPSYTPLTERTGRWLDGVAVPKDAQEHRLKGTRVSLREIIGEQSEGQRRHITVFCGHGIEDALLGPPLNDERDIDRAGERHSIIYSTEPFEPNPKALFAFCCNSATKLGPKFSSTADASFLGFGGELSFVSTNDQYMNTLRAIVSRTAERIISDGDITPKHEKMLRRFYRQAYNYYLNGEGRKNQYWWMMTYFLNKQRLLIRYYRGAPSN
ncbi:MAG: hypothetical protein QOJ70_3483 [Acidobacteriota bacterium]|jgi:hypothetical protein|nr:hypothetical protein [Acidobacteriota bacterium]MDT7809670.1 hypothetical protein [Acidobacteriota bacterium]